jgi:hypothetical protein
MGAIRRATGQHYINDNGEPQLPAATTLISGFGFPRHASFFHDERLSRPITRLSRSFSRSS